MYVFIVQRLAAEVIVQSEIVGKTTRCENGNNVYVSLL